ncbi:MAG: mechanosensitive ion channel family protein, partial [Candidatus Altiarchaeota archaeon]|nr:mechanosensitive ion channel family protein [Candidatus Altiarchaeota archaeon]
KALKRNMPSGTAKSLSRIVYYVFMFILVMVVLSLLGVDVQILLTAGGVLGIAIGFASQKTVSNLISGIFLYIDRPMDIGDAVDIEGTSGVILDITPLSTRLRSWEGPIVRMPNSKVFDSKITNYKKTAARRIEYKLGISYNSKVDKAIKVIRKILDDEPFVLDSPGPGIWINNLLDSSVELTIRAWAPASKAFSVKTQMLQKIYEALNKNKIEIPYPQMDIHLKRR